MNPNKPFKNLCLKLEILQNRFYLPKLMLPRTKYWHRFLLLATQNVEVTNAYLYHLKS